MKIMSCVPMLFCFVLTLLSCTRSDNHDAARKPDIANKPIERKAPPVDTCGYVDMLGNYLHTVNLNLKNLSSKKVDVFGGSAEGGEIYVYTSKEDTVKVRALFYGESGKAEYILYFKNRELKVFNQKMTYYRSQIGNKPVEIDNMSNKLFFMDKGQVIAAKNENGEIVNENYSQKSVSIRQVYQEIIQQFND